MSFIQLDPNTTFCPDTPENWAEFHRLKAQIQNNGQTPKNFQSPKPSRPHRRKPVIFYGYNTCR